MLRAHATFNMSLIRCRQAPPNAFPCHGNDQTMNIHNILHSNILDSEYFQFKCAYGSAATRRGLMPRSELLTVGDVVDEIYNEVKYVEPFVPGGRSSPSTAFCLLFTVATLNADSWRDPIQLFCMRITEKQLFSLINHRDSPCARRAIAHIHEAAGTFARLDSCICGTRRRPTSCLTTAGTTSTTRSPSKSACVCPHAFRAGWLDTWQRPTRPWCRWASTCAAS